MAFPLSRTFFSRRCVAVALLSSAFTVAAMHAQAPQAMPAPGTSSTSDLPAGTTAATPDSTPTAVMSNTAPKRGRVRKAEEKKDNRVVQSKDTVKDEKAMKKRLKDNPLANVNSTQPDKQLYDKALEAIQKGRFEVARLDLQTLLSTYQDSEYQMRAKLAFADSWYREGGTAAFAQAETEYHDFIIFFPNAPEAAEAQMRIGDIYFKQMDRPDRDYTKAVHAQEEYRTMLTQYPDSTLIPDAKQKLREVQEALATRETEIGQFYTGRENWSAAIARYQTVVDTYPLYSHIDETLIGLGDAYAAQGRYIRGLKLPEESRARLLRVYDDEAVAAYSRVVTQYAASNHVEDARDRLEVMQVPIPVPTAEQLAASQALEDSRGTYTLANRAKGLLLRGPDMIQAARIGDPPLADPKATLAPQINSRNQEIFKNVLNPTPGAATVVVTPAVTTATDAPAAVAPVAPTTTSLQDIPAADAGTTTTSTFTPAAANANVPTGGGKSVGVEILTPGVNGATPASTPAPRYGLTAVGPAKSTIPAIERPEIAPDAVNDVANVKTPVAQAAPVTKPGKKVKNPTPDFDKGDESSSTHKKKKGLKKLNPL